MPTLFITTEVLTEAVVECFVFKEYLVGGITFGQKASELLLKLIGYKLNEIILRGNSLHLGKGGESIPTATATFDDVSKDSVKYADALIEKLNEKK